MSFTLVLLTGAAALPAWAQAYSSSLTGVVSDPSGAVIPDARAMLTNEQNGFQYSAATDVDGRYLIRNLLPGNYRLSVSAPGMQAYNQSGITLTVGQNAQVNVNLRLQGVTQSVSVSATAPLLDTQDASTGQVVNRKFINDLPLTTRSVFNLAQLAPGVTQPAGNAYGLNTRAVNFISNGERNSTADILIDGVSQTSNEQNSGVTTALYTPEVDAVEEFKAQQNTYSAEVGFGATVINLTTKSGTNQFHGSLFEFLQNNALNANNFFNNQSGRKINPSRQNQFGGTLGGPIRKNKTFFFFDYQGTRSRSTRPANAGVPSLAERRRGDFGEVCARNGGVFDAKGKCSVASGQILDPYSSVFNSKLNGAVRSVGASQLLLPYPQFTGFGGNDPPWANSVYNALQLQVEKRFRHGLQVLGTYVWSKSIDDSSVTCNCTRFLGGSTSLQDPNRRKLERSVSGYDIPQVFQFSYVYQLPFGKGQRWGSNWNGFVDAVLGGWQTNGIWRFDNGIPVSLGLSTSRALPTYGGQRPNLVGALTRNNGANWMNQYFANPQVAVTPPPFTVGTAPRELDTVRIPGTATSALSTFKQFPLSRLHEGSLVEFRAEAFNALNHPQFGGPNTTVGSSAFGRVSSQANSPRQLGLKLYF